jgi:hypothetical protein
MQERTAAIDANSTETQPSPRARISRNRDWTRENALLLVATALVVIAITLPLLHIAFSCDDDMYTATARFRSGGILNASWAIASGQGRFYQLFVYTLAQLPFLPGSLDFVGWCRLISTGTCFLVFLLLCRALFEDIRLGLAATCLAAGVLETRYMFNPFHALPMWFNLGIAVGMLACLVWKNAGDRDSNRERWWGAFLLLVAGCFYEAYMLFGPAMAVISLFRMPKGSRGRIGRWAVGEFAPLLASASLYAAMLVGFRLKFPSSYAGNKLSLASFRSISATAWAFTASGVNWSAPARLPENFAAHPNTHTPAIIALVIAAVIFAVLRRKEITTVPLSRLCRAGAVAGAIMVVPNLPFAFTERYRSWVEHGDIYYHGSFCAGFGWAMLLLAGAALLLRPFRSPVIRLGLPLMLSVAVAMASFANLMDSRRFYGQHAANRKIWQLVGEALPHLEVPPEASIVVAPSLGNLPLLAADVYDYWSFYFSRQLGRPVKVLVSQRQWNEYFATAQEASPVAVFQTWCCGPQRSGVAALAIADHVEWGGRGPEALVSQAAVYYHGAPDRAFLTFPFFGEPGHTPSFVPTPQSTDAGTAVFKLHQNRFTLRSSHAEIQFFQLRMMPQ